MTGVYEERDFDLLVVRRDDNNREITRWNPDGTISEGYPRPYNDEENAEADARVTTAAEVVEQEDTVTKLITVDLPAMQAILAQTNADLRADPSQEIKDIATAIRRIIKRLEPTA